MPPIHHQRLVEAVEANFCWDWGWSCFCLPGGFRFFLTRLFFLDIETPFFFPISSPCYLVTPPTRHLPRSEGGRRCQANPQWGW